MKRAWRECWPYLFVLGLTLGGVLVSAHEEAKVFNRCTGSNVSTWDALFVQLRVENCR